MMPLSSSLPLSFSSKSSRCLRLLATVVESSSVGTRRLSSSSSSSSRTTATSRLIRCHNHQHSPTPQHAVRIIPCQRWNHRCYSASRVDLFSHSTSSEKVETITADDLSFSTTAVAEDDKVEPQPQPQQEQEQIHALQHSTDTTDSATTSTDFDIPGTRMGGSRTLAILYTCGVCDTRSMKQFTERAYRHGVVMVQCPGCRNWHLIADHLGYFEEHFLQQEENDTSTNDDHSTLEQAQSGGSTHWDIFQHLQQKQQQSQKSTVPLNAKVVNHDNVWELTLEDIMGTDKYHQIMERANAATSDPHDRSDDQGNNVAESENVVSTTSKS